MPSMIYSILYQKDNLLLFLIPLSIPIVLNRNTNTRYKNTLVFYWNIAESRKAMVKFIGVNLNFLDRDPSGFIKSTPIRKAIP